VLGGVHSLDSPSFNLISTPNKLLAVSSTGKSLACHTLLLSSSNVPPPPPVTRSFANPNKLPVKEGCDLCPIAPVPKLNCHLDDVELFIPWPFAGDVVEVSDPEPTGWCNMSERNGNKGSGGMY